MTHLKIKEQKKIKHHYEEQHEKKVIKLFRGTFEASSSPSLLGKEIKILGKISSTGALN